MIQINKERFLSDLHALRAIGAMGKGVVRQALTATDVEARRWLAQRMREADIQPVWDPVGNLFGLGARHRGGVLIGSHADTQPQGGWLDGAYGVVCGLEIARAAREARVEGVSCVAFSDEEGYFQPLLGSRFWVGEVGLGELDDIADGSGRRFAEARAAIPEMRGAAIVPADLFGAFLEPHIEQGPVLDTSGESLAIVTAIAGVRQIELVFTGEQNHAGTTPMPLRRDAMRSFLSFAADMGSRFHGKFGEAVWTFGKVEVHPNAVSIIPGSVRAVLQIRTGNASDLHEMTQICVAAARENDRRGPCKVEATIFTTIEPSLLDAGLIEVLTNAVSGTGQPGVRKMLSGALHDAAPVSRRIASGMIFVPSKGGISHNFEEDTEHEHLVQGCELIAAAVAQLVSP